MRKLLGTRNGKRVYAVYGRDGQSSLPTLRIGARQWRGSSLGPTNAEYAPEEQDFAYWRTIARESGLID